MSMEEKLHLFAWTSDVGGDEIHFATSTSDMTSEGWLLIETRTVSFDPPPVEGVRERMKEATRAKLADKLATLQAQIDALDSRQVAAQKGQG